MVDRSVVLTPLPTDGTLPPRLLILGAGAVVAEYYAPALAALGYLSHTLIVDRDMGSLRRLREHYPAAQFALADFRTLIDSLPAGAYDAAVVALPNWLHEEACSRALAAGLHVLCEKPLALQRTVCLNLAEQADSVGRLLAVGMVRRYLPSIVALRAALKHDLIGPIRSIEIEDGAPYAWMSESGSFFQPQNGGVLADMGVHYLDLAEFLWGSLVPLQYQDDARGGVEANAEFHLRTVSGVPVRLALSRMYTLHNSLVVHGERGRLVVGKHTPDHCEWHPEGGALAAVLRPESPFSDSRLPHTFESCFVEQFAQFAAALRGGVAPVDGRAAASVIGLIEWAYQQRQPALPATPAQRPTLPAAQVVVTGGTGFIGAHLIERLHESGAARIVAPVRRYRTCAPIARFPVSMPRVDLLDRAQVQQSLEGARYVFHLAYGNEGKRPEQVTIEGTQAVVDAAIAVGAECVVVLSTMYVFGQHSTGSVMDETAPYAPAGGVYGQSKMVMEQWCLERARSANGTRIVVLNPACVYGPGGKTYTALPAELARTGAFCWVDGGRGAANYTYVDNLVDAMVLAATCPAAHGERFIINDGATTWRALIEPLLGGLAQSMPTYSSAELKSMQQQGPTPGIGTLIRAVAREQRVVDTFKAIPAARKALGLVERWLPDAMDRVRAARRTVPPPLLDAPTSLPIPPVWLVDLFGPTDAVFSSAKAQAILGWVPRVGLAEGQQHTIDWLRVARLLERTQND